MGQKIHIDDDVLEGLKALAEPFVDTPNTVIKRLLQEKGIIKVEGKNPALLGLTKKRERFYGGSLSIIQRQMRAKVGEVTPQSKYEDWLLKTLYTDFNGCAPKAEVTEIVIAKMEEAGILKEVDYETVSTGETRSTNTIAWARNALKDRGLIKKDSPRGIWELTSDGIEKAKKLLSG